MEGKLKDDVEVVVHCGEEGEEAEGEEREEWTEE